MSAQPEPCPCRGWLPAIGFGLFITWLFVLSILAAMYGCQPAPIP